VGAETIVGQERALRVLRSARARDRLPAAYLFTGPEGIGKRTAALELAASLSCEAGGESSCGACRSCHLVRDGRHPDVLVPERSGNLIPKNPPASGGREREASGYLSEIIPRLQFAPVMGRWKVVLLDDAHEITDTAANFLLKTLEEPPSRTLFILVSAAEHRLLPTVISRCQRVRFSPLAEEQVLAILLRRGTDPALARRAAHLAGGSVGRALGLLHGGRAEALAGWMDLLRGLGRMTPADRLRHVGTLLAAGGGRGGERAALEAFVEASRAWLEERLEALARRDGPEPAEQEKLLSLFDTLRDIDAGVRVNANPRVLADHLAGRLAGVA